MFLLKNVKKMNKDTMLFLINKLVSSRVEQLM